MIGSAKILLASKPLFQPVWNSPTGYVQGGDWVGIQNNYGECSFPFHSAPVEFTTTKSQWTFSAALCDEIQMSYTPPPSPPLPVPDSIVVQVLNGGNWVTLTGYGGSGIEVIPGGPLIISAIGVYFTYYGPNGLSGLYAIVQGFQYHQVG